jgi:hypothetical protein
VAHQTISSLSLLAVQIHTSNGNSTGQKSTGITVATTNANAGTSGTNANLPPYYALCYIMKT